MIRSYSLAAENNLAETGLLWFGRGRRLSLALVHTTTEVPLCGHATLASAAAVMERSSLEQHGVFHT